MYIVSKFLTARKIENNRQKKKMKNKPLFCCLSPLSKVIPQINAKIYYTKAVVVLPVNRTTPQ